MKKPIDTSTIKRILITRFDRIGDVVLSSSVFPAIRQAYPEAHVAVLVLPGTERIVRGNPWINQVIVYDKRGRDGSWLKTILFANRLKAERFDVVIHLHATTRVHLLSYLAKIPIRIGYRKKDYYFLTHTISEMKWMGLRHEAEYNFDLLTLIGVKQPRSLESFFSLDEGDSKALGRVTRKELKDPYVVFHPSAIGPSKIWPPERFGAVADQLTMKYGVSAVIIGEGAGIKDAGKMEQAMKTRPLNLAGCLSLGMLGSLLKGARLMISNDSGPAHIAAAVKTPVIVIFGRNKAGLGSARWKPLSEESSALQKDVGCTECLADDCVIHFKCLLELSVDEVLEEVRRYEPYLAEARNAIKV